MTSLFPAMLAGLSALAIPVVIHLIARHRFPVRDLPTTRFLAAHRRTNILAPRLVDVPQLLMRLAVLIAIVLAMARLFGGASLNAAPRNVVLVLDTSSSMKMRRDGGRGPSAFEVSVIRAREVASALPPRSRCALVADGSDGPIEVALGTDIAAVSARLGELAPIDGRGRSLPELAARSAAMLAGRREARSQVVVFTDLRLSALSPTAATARQALEDVRKEMGAALELVLVDVAEGMDSNIGVVAAELRGGEARVGDDAHVVARLRNSGAKPVEATVKLTIGGRAESPPRKLAIEPNSEAVMDLTMRVNRAASALARVEIEPDAYGADDAASAPVTVVDSRRVLLVTPGDTTADGVSAGLPCASRTEPAAALGASRATPKEPSGVDGAAILRFALNPGRELGSGQSSGIEVTQVASDAVATQPLSKYDLIILYGVARLSGQALADVQALVEQGRSVLVLFPESTPALEFNRFLAAGAAPTTATGTASAARESLIPMRLGNVRTLEPVAGLRVVDPAHPLLAPYHDPLRGDLSSVQFHAVRELLDLPADARVLARATGGQPLIVESPVGRGRALVMAFGVELSAGNLARSRVFPVLMWRVVDYLTGRLDRAPQAALTAMRPTMVEVTDPSLTLAGELEVAALFPSAATRPLDGVAASTRPTSPAAPGAGPFETRRLSVDAHGAALLPPLPSGQFIVRRGAGAAGDRAGARGGGASGMMLSVLADPNESRMERADGPAVAEAMGAGVRVLNESQLASLAPPGREWTPWLVAAAAILYLIEATTSWMASARRERQRVTETPA